MKRAFFFRRAALAAALCMAAGANASDCLDDPTISPFVRAMKADPKNLESQFNVAFKLYNKVASEGANSACLDDALDALKHFQKSASGKSNVPADMMSQAYYATGAILIELKNDTDGGVAAFKKVLQYSPNDKESLYGIAIGLKKMGEDKEAIEYFYKTVKANPDNFLAFSNLAVMLDQKYGEKATPEQTGEIKSVLENAVRVGKRNKKENGPQLVKCMNRLGELYDKAGQVPKAIEVLNEAVRIDNNDVDSHALLGQMYSRSKNYLKMTEEYEKVIELNPDSLIARHNLGAAYTNQEQYAKAYRQFAYITEKLGSNDPEVLVYQAQTLEKALVELMTEGGKAATADDYLKAKQDFEEVLKLDPRNKEAKKLLDQTEEQLENQFSEHMGRAKKMLSADKKIAAAEEVEKALALKPDNEEAKKLREKVSAVVTQLVKLYLSRGDAAFRKSDYGTAEDEYRKALAIPSGRKQAQEKLSKLTVKYKGEFDDALRDAKGAMKRNELVKARNAFRRALAAKKDDREASAGLLQANQKISEKIKKSMAEGEKFFEGGQKDKARKEFEAILRLDPNDSKAKDYYKRLTGTESKAAVDADKVKKLYYKGVDFYVNNKIKDAIAAWQELLSLDPNHLDARRNIERAKTKLAALERLKS